MISQSASGQASLNVTRIGAHVPLSLHQICRGVIWSCLYALLPYLFHVSIEYLCHFFEDLLVVGRLEVVLSFWFFTLL